MGKPKALLRYGHDSGLEQALRCLADAGVQRSVVVLGAEADRVIAAHGDALGQPGVSVEIHRAWSRGRSSSLKAGLRRLAPDVAGVVLHTVDHPLVQTSTVRSLIENWATGSSALLVPTHTGRRGHPIVIDRCLFGEILALGDDEPLHRVVNRDAARVQEIVVADPGVLVNVNSPEDHAQALETMRGNEAEPKAEG